MSSRPMKISWYIVIVLANLGFSRCVRRSAEKTINDYYSGKCVKRSNTRHPTARCAKYLQCDSYGHAIPTECPGGEIFNITSKKCVNSTFSCQVIDTKKLNFYRWNSIHDTYSEIVKRGGMLPVPPTIDQDIEYFDKITPIHNYQFYALLKTRYLAVEDGLHKFHSKCKLWCKIWIRREECGTRELVLHQKKYNGSADVQSYHVQKGFNMSFGTFYYLEAVHVGDAGKSFVFQLGVEWPGESKKDKIPAVLLRLPRKKVCPIQSPINVSPTNTASHVLRSSPATTGTSSLSASSTLIVRQTTTGTPSPTAKLRDLTSSLSSRPISSSQSSVSQTSVLNKSTQQTSTVAASTALPKQTTSTPSTKSATTPPGKTTASQSTKSATTPPGQTTSTKLATALAGLKTPSPSPKSEVQGLAEMVDEFLSSDNQTNRSSSHQKNQDDGLFQARQVDLKGEKIAEQWNKPGKSMTVYHKNVVMEVDFPLSNYTFPRKKVIAQVGKEFQSDRIFIPAQALVSGSGKFERKVFSTLYLNLNEKIPRSFNVVETETNEIRGSYQLNSHMIASTAVPSLSGLQAYDIVIRLAHLRTNVTSDVKLMCAFFKWNNEMTSDGVWSTEGCIRDEKLSSENVSVCRCNHLTHFAILMQIEEQEISPTHLKALRFITYIGCALSLIGAGLTVMAITCLPGTRSDRNFIHVNLAVAIGLAQITFLAGIDETGIEVVCTIVAALLHYFLLVAFSWMLIEGIFLHILIVKVFHDHLPKKRFYVTFCWGLPLVVVLLAVNLLRDGYGTKTSCWLSTDKFTIWTFSGPAILVMTINIVILCKVMKEISSLKTSDRTDSNIRSIRYGVRSTIILLPLLGLAWAFGLICVNEDLIVFQYLFTIFNSLQGLFIFLFHCVFNTEVRKAFWRKVDVWFTNHNNPFGNNNHSRSSFKRSKDDPSSTCSPEKEKKMPQRNGFSMYSFSDLTEQERRKLSTTTASTCVDPWPHKLSITPSVDNGPFPKRFTPTLSDDDIKYRPIYKQGNAGQKRIAPNTLEIGVKVEDLNGNTESLDRDVQKQSEQSEQQNVKTNGQYFEVSKTNEESYIQKQQQQQQNYEERSNENETLASKIQQNPRFTKHDSRESFADEVTVGIGGQPTKFGDSKGHVRKIEVNNIREKVSNITDRNTTTKTNANNETKL